MRTRKGGRFVNVNIRLKTSVGILVVLFAVCGCIPEKGASGSGQPGGFVSLGDSAEPGEALFNELLQLTDEELLARWKERAFKDDVQLADRECVWIGSVLASSGPEALEPFLDVIADPEVDWRPKVVATNTMKPLLEVSMISKLAEMTDVKTEGTTRACAADLLRALDTPESVEPLRALRNDKDGRVRLAALTGLASQGEAEARQDLREMFFARNTRRSDKAMIVLALASAGPSIEDAAVLTEAVVGTDMSASDKTHALGALGQIGDSDTSMALEHYVASGCPEELREIVNATVAAIKERI